jgi:NAD(P)-dependent dehydrogenase (short-subunit alcohol dehydrogenase family)
MRRVLVVGGTGTFGSRLVRGLVANTDFHVIVGGRHMERSSALAADLFASSPHAHLTTVVTDRENLTEHDLRRLELFAVVDAAGPFQGGDYRLPRAAVAAGVHYVDLADARDFVAGFAALDAAAKTAGVSAVTGASSTPALSHAVLDRLTEGWRSIETVEVGISPGNRAPRGLSVIRAILSYVGRPVRVFLDGGWQQRPGWSLLVRKPMPGLGVRWLSLCETPDLDLIPTRFRVRREAIFRAGLELSILHLGLSAAALLVRLRLIASLVPFASTFRLIAESFRRLGTDRGGMIVEAAGTDPEGKPIAARWSLLAEKNDGPVIPTLPALALLRALAEGQVPSGAGPAAGLLSLAAIEEEFRPYNISTATQRMGGSLFARTLSGFESMPNAIKQAHSIVGRTVLRGEAEVEGAANRIGGLVAKLFGLPTAASRVPVTVTMEARPEGETWVRDFGGRRFRSALKERPGKGLSERFGLLTFDLDVPTSKFGLTMSIVAWRLGPIPLPATLAPRTVAREELDGFGRFRFDVTIALPGLGRLVRYQGWLVPEEPADAA